ncbi:MAG: argininosuccinate lyase [Chloroflexi bacterium]|nr:argininosuccinate lyase [Chloroflexota bacterium]MBV9595268.1 argininosuccinate lyase [Chloroflexota bacterium]
MTDQGYSLRIGIPRLELPDFYASMSQMNKASLVMLHEAGIVSTDLASRIAIATQQLIDREQLPGARRSHDYLDFERDLLAAAGPEASWLHVGRSRQDMLSTGVSLWLRAAHLAFFEDLLQVRSGLVDLASRHMDTVIPIYTHGVQAQPTSFGHYLLAFLAGLDRTASRARESFNRANRSPLGAGAGTTSSFLINRERLAQLLGFDGLVDNAFDANLVAPVDSALELVQVFATLAVQIGQLTQDLMAQFYLVDSWLSLDPGAMLTGISSMMPQKRNPRVLEVLREHASIIIGSAESMTLLAHNVTSGMSDVRETVTSIVPAERMHEMLYLLTRTIEAMVVDPRRSLAEVNRDYSAMTNLAECLVQSAHVPFREAHEFASRLTDDGRRRGLRPPEINYADAVELYRACTSSRLPLSEADFAAAIDARNIIATRRGRGGPQAAEVERMLDEATASIAAHRRWLEDQRAATREAESQLDLAFRGLVNASKLTR